PASTNSAPVTQATRLQVRSPSGRREMPFMNRDRTPGVRAFASSLRDPDHDRTTSPGPQGSRKSSTLGGMFRVANVRRKPFAVIGALAAVVYLAAAAQSAWAVTPL